MKKEIEEVRTPEQESNSIQYKKNFGRREVLGGLALGGAGVAATAFFISCGDNISKVSATVPSDNTSGDKAQQIFTAALIAEGLAITFYYNVLVGSIIQSPELAGSGGSATNVTTSHADDVGYLRAALQQEIDHANLLRSLIGGTSATGDPNQTFYFDSTAFALLTPMLATLDALENAFIGAYMTAVQEFAQMAADVKSAAAEQLDSTGKAYTSVQLEYFAKVAASIMGVECEHRVLGRSIGGAIPADNLCFEQTDGLTAVFNGNTSAVAALTPFLTPGTGKTAFSFATALAGSTAIVLPCTGGVPS